MRELFIKVRHSASLVISVAVKVVWRQWSSLSWRRRYGALGHVPPPPLTLQCNVIYYPVTVARERGSVSRRLCECTVTWSLTSSLTKAANRGWRAATRSMKGRQQLLWTICGNAVEFTTNSNSLEEIFLDEGITHASPSPDPLALCTPPRPKSWRRYCISCPTPDK